MSVLEGSLGILPRRILVDDEHQEEARQLLVDAGLAHELRPRTGGTAESSAALTDDAVLGGRLRLRAEAARPSRRPRRDPACGRNRREVRRSRDRAWRGRRRRGPSACRPRRGPDRDAGRDRPGAFGARSREHPPQRLRGATHRSHARRDRARRGLRRRRHRAGLGRSRADEPAVQQRAAAERLARSAAPHGARRIRGAAARLGRGRAPAPAIRRACSP